jgi:hypothetical protein
MRCFPPKAAAARICDIHPRGSVLPTRKILTRTKQEHRVNCDVTIGVLPGDMSVVIQVFLAAERMPNPEQRAAAIRAHGFDMDLDPDFDVREFTGFLSLQVQGA